jgi:hypothetical protein
MNLHEVLNSESFKRRDDSFHLCLEEDCVIPVLIAYSLEDIQ